MIPCKRSEKKSWLLVGLVILVLTSALFFIHVDRWLVRPTGRMTGAEKDHHRMLVQAVTKQPQRKNRKKVVYVCTNPGCGGWGDREKGIVGAYVLSAMMDRDFGIVLTFPCNVDRFLTSNKVDWKMAQSELTGPSTKEYRWFDGKSIPPLKKMLGSNADLEKEFPSDVTVIKLNMELVQFLRNHSAARSLPWLAERNGKTVADIYRLVLNDLFSLKPELGQQLKTFRDQIPPNATLVCVQVRLGNHDGFSDSETFNDIKHFPVVSDFLAKYNASKKYRILVASDSKQVVKFAQESFPSVILTLPGPITHSDKTKGAAACDGFGRTILDQYALSTCDVLVISESGLSKIASFLRGSDKDLYIFSDGKIEPYKRDQKFPHRVW